ncbi:MAG: hypothetical protein OXC29_13615, partial [Rhodococcus sp.]|nr:hypothetical protein [Rhodococcus sp. (in: high G+C Gram-positive bacteria)]
MAEARKHTIATGLSAAQFERATRAAPEGAVQSAGIATADYGTVIFMGDQTALPAPGGGSTAAVGSDRLMIYHQPPGERFGVGWTVTTLDGSGASVNRGASGQTHWVGSDRARRWFGGGGSVIASAADMTWTGFSVFARLVNNTIFEGTAWRWNGSSETFQRVVTRPDVSRSPRLSVWVVGEVFPYLDGAGEMQFAATDWPDAGGRGGVDLQGAESLTAGDGFSLPAARTSPQFVNYPFTEGWVADG